MTTYIWSSIDFDILINFIDSGLSCFVNVILDMFFNPYEDQSWNHLTMEGWMDSLKAAMLWISSNLDHLGSLALYYRAILFYFYRVMAGLHKKSLSFSVSAHFHVLLQGTAIFLKSPLYTVNDLGGFGQHRSLLVKLTTQFLVLP